MTAMVQDWATGSSDVHGDLDCRATEHLLQEANAENALLTTELEMRREADDRRQAEMDALRAEINGTRALLAHLQKAAEATVGLKDQLQMVMAELLAAEEVAVPEGTAAVATISEADLVALVRKAVGQQRGPLSRANQDLTASMAAAAREAMTSTGMETAAAVLRREMNRRRQAARRAACRTSAR